MSPRFGDAALALCALAARTLGWRPEEFWSATPVELATALGAGAGPVAAPGVDRALLARLMEHDNER